MEAGIPSAAERVRDRIINGTVRFTNESGFAVNLSFINLNDQEQPWIRLEKGETCRCYHAHQYSQSPTV